MIQLFESRLVDRVEVADRAVSAPFFPRAIPQPCKANATIRHNFNRIIAQAAPHRIRTRRWLLILHPYEFGDNVFRGDCLKGLLHQIYDRDSRLMAAKYKTRLLRARQDRVYAFHNLRNMAVDHLIFVSGVHTEPKRYLTTLLFSRLRLPHNAGDRMIGIAVKRLGYVQRLAGIPRHSEKEFPRHRQTHRVFHRV